MAKKTQSYFGPSLGESLVHLPSAHGLARQATPEPASPRIQTLFDEADVQYLTIEAQAIKTGLGLTEFADLHQHAASLFGDTLNTILETKEQVLNKEAQPIVDEFTTRLISLYGRQTLGALEVGGKAIGYEIGRALYVPPAEPEAKKGFWQRLFGA